MSKLSNIEYVIAEATVLKVDPADGIIKAWRQVGKDQNTWHELPKDKFTPLKESMHRKATREEYIKWMLADEQPK